MLNEVIDGNGGVERKVGMGRWVVFWELIRGLIIFERGEKLFGWRCIGGVDGLCMRVKDGGFEINL